MKTVWITGGGSGIGKALALKMVEHGYKVFISGRTLEKLQQVGNGTIPIACDITKPQEVNAALDQMFGIVQGFIGFITVVVFYKGYTGIGHGVFEVKAIEIQI